METLSPDAVQALFDGIIMGASRHAKWEWDQSVTIGREEDDVNLGVKAARHATPMHIINWAEAQKEDPELGAAITWLKTNFPLECGWTEHLAKLKQLMGPAKDTPDGRAVLRTVDKLTLSGGVLYQRHCLKDAQDVIKQFVMPRAHHQKVTDGCHRDAGHQGRDQKWTLVEDRFWWPRACEDVVQAVKNCKKCNTHERKDTWVPLVSVVATLPLQIVHVDYTSFETTMQLNKAPRTENVLVIVDHFTCYMRAYVTKDHKAETTVRYLYDGYISIFTCPEKVFSDCGSHNSTVCLIWPLHTQCNGQVETANQTLAWMIGKLEPQQKKE